MTSGILRIKISPPPLQPHILERERLIEHLEHGLTTPQGFARPLTLISAPAGFGKTTTVRRWLSGAEKTVCWYALDTEDSLPDRFWTYVIHALRSVHEQVGATALELLRSGGASEALLTPLLNDLFALEQPTVLVLDDYHNIDNAQIHRDMAFLLENLPPTLHIAVTTRSDPPWPLHRYRARGQMTEVRLKDLRFSVPETALLLEQLPLASLTEKQVQLLWDKTEGWITGLQLAASSLAQSDNSNRFLESFAGSHRHVLHFLSEEILSQQSPAVQEFLLQTSILERFCAELCDTVTQGTDSQELLEYLEQKNVFILPLDEHGEWYRYHPLFADLLQHHLKRLHPEQLSPLHQRAVQWFLSRGDSSAALDQALRADMLPEAANLLDAHESRIIQSENPWQLRHSLELFPQELLQKYPRLLVHKALHHLINHGRESARPWLELAEHALEDGSSCESGCRGMLKAVRAYFHVYAHEFAEAAASAEEALADLAPDNHYWRMNVAIYSGDTRLFAGDPQAAYPYYVEAQRASSQMQNRFAQLTAGFKVATSLTYLGRLRAARQLLEELLREAQAQGFGQVSRVGLLWTLLGEIEREEGALAEAERCVNRGLLYSELEAPSYAWNCLTQVALYVSQGRWLEALYMLDEVAALHETQALPRFVTDAAVPWRAQVLLLLGNREQSHETLRACGIAEGAPLKPGQERGFLVLARLLLEEGSRETAQDVLARITAAAREGRFQKLLLETRLLQTAAADAASQGEQAQEAFDEAFFVALQCGFYQTWLDSVSLGGDSVAPRLKKRAAEEGPGALLAQRLLAGMGEAPLPQQAPPPVSEKASPLVEELSVREQEILGLISEGLSNDGIAQQLFLSLSTVKWHTSNIYGKLGVRSRTEAAALARELGILS